MHWKEVAAFLEGKCKEYVSEGGKKPQNGYARGYVLPSGLQLAIETNSDGLRTNVWIEDCGPPPVPSQFQLYKKDKSRTSALSSVAPLLSGPGYSPPPKRAYKVLVKSNQELDALFNWYSGLDRQKQMQLATQGETTVTTDEQNQFQVPLNQILYGPPGTGKTYRTAARAVEICDGNANLSAEHHRTALMARYEELRKQGRISFVTFHQSYGYEDFVEGLRPELKDGQVSYHVRPGIFREVCVAAKLKTLIKPGLSGAPLKERTIYKMSLGRVGSAEGKQALQTCLEKGYVVLGWGEDLDYFDCTCAEEIRKKLEEERPNIENPEIHARFLNVFKNEVKVDDIIIVSQGNSAFRAIGVVTGEHELLDAPAAGAFYQKRNVRWLADFEGNRAVSEIYDRTFMQIALYRLKSEGLNFDALNSLIAGDAMAGPQNCVLVIDEINRANISKVFGELITLLEQDKREGTDNAITLKLPYSGEEFCVPKNLYVVGTMNTADRSIALLDTALRRRFEFQELLPDVSSLPENPIDGVDLRAMLKAMNERIEYLYDRDHTIGHAYFIRVKSLAELESVFRNKVIPLLQEYFFENLSKVQLVLNDKDGAFIEVLTGIPFGLEAASDGLDPKPRYRVRDGHFPVSAYLNMYKQ